MVKRVLRAVLIPLVLVLMLAGCTVNRDIMFKTPTDFEYDVIPDTVDFRNLFRIQRNDYLEFRLFANDGFKLIDLVSESGMDARAVQRMTFKYLVEYDGLVKLPLLGRVKLADMTIREAEMFLEDQYVEFYNRPFVQLFVTNRRVVVFPGGGGDAQVVNLENNNTTLLEVLASARGLPRRANAHKVKLFRKDDQGKRLVYLFDLSTIDGLKHADIVMQGDDIVYVQPNPEIARELLYDLTPLITLLTTVLLVLGIANSFKN